MRPLKAFFGKYKVFNYQILLKNKSKNNKSYLLSCVYLKLKNV